MKNIFLRVKIRIYSEWYSLKLKREVRNKDFTIICNNCWGGKIYEQLNLQYRTPFVGLYLFAPCYIKLISNLNSFINLELKFINASKYEIANSSRRITENFYPIGLINDDIEIHFLHYHSEKEAQEKWLKRKSRINYENIYFAFSERDSCTYKELSDFDSLNLPNKVCFTAKKYPEMKSTIFIKEYSEIGEVGDIYTASNLIHKYFNTAAWLNGKPFRK